MPIHQSIDVKRHQLEQRIEKLSQKYDVVSKRRLSLQNIFRDSYSNFYDDHLSATSSGCLGRPKPF